MLDQFLWGHSSRVCDISCYFPEWLKEEHQRQAAKTFNTVLSVQLEINMMIQLPQMMTAFARSLYQSQGQEPKVRFCMTTVILKVFYVFKFILYSFTVTYLNTNTELTNIISNEFSMNSLTSTLRPFLNCFRFSE